VRFTPEIEAGNASCNPGLFYRLDYSQLVRFVCIDTSLADDLPEDRYFAHPRHLDFVRDALSPRDGKRWRIPFCHHPPFCAGPKHHNDDDMIEHLVPCFEQGGVRLVLSGHEHNFQYSVHRGVHYLVSGAGGKLREGEPDGFADAHTPPVSERVVAEIGCSLWGETEMICGVLR
jgi:tartrate-resistant acid phosphatase type 5